MASRSPQPARQLRLIGPFQARRQGHVLVVPHSVARLLAMLSLVGPMSRLHAGEQLWCDTDQPHASANLRAALGRRNAIDDGFIEVSGDVLSIGDEVGIDVEEVLTWVNTTIYGTSTQAAAPPSSTGREVLSGWEEPWLSDPRERVRLLQSQALETAAERL